MAGIGQDLKKIYSDETRIVENASLCSGVENNRVNANIYISKMHHNLVKHRLVFARPSLCVLIAIGFLLR